MRRHSRGAGGGTPGVRGGPLVSVIMPTHNRGWIIRRAIDSVLAQTMGDLELLVADDGSEDGSRQVLAAVDDTRVRVLTLSHAGAAAARNAALELARGELVAYLDTDNVWHGQFLEVMTGELPGDAVLAYCGLHRFLIEGDREQFRVTARKVDSRPFNPVALRQGNFIDLNTVLHRRSVLAEVGGFEPSLPRLLDWDLVARIALRHPYQIRHVDQVLCDYYYFPARMTRTLTNAAMDDAQLRALFGLGDRDEATETVRRRLEHFLASPAAGPGARAAGGGRAGG